LKLALKNEMKHLYSAMLLSKSCHNCQNCVTTSCVRPKVHKSYPKIVWRFSKSCHDLPPVATSYSASKIVSRL